MTAVSITRKILGAMQAMLRAAIGEDSGAPWEIADATIDIAKLPYGDELGLPGILLVPVAELEGKGTNASDDIGYGVQVTIVQASDGDVAEHADRLFYWREQAASAFRHQALTGVSEIHDCTIEPRPAVDPAAFSGNVDVTAFVVRAWQRKQRP